MNFPWRLRPAVGGLELVVLPPAAPIFSAAAEEKAAREAISSGDRATHDLNRAFGKATETVTKTAEAHATAALEADRALNQVTMAEERQAEYEENLDEARLTRDDLQLFGEDLQSDSADTDRGALATELTRLQREESTLMQQAEEMMQARKDMTMRAREYVQQQFDVFGAGATQQFRDEFLAEKRINEMDRSDLERMKPLVQKLAKRLASKHSRRRKKKNRGQLNIRKTLRSNAGRDGVPFEVHWRQTKKDRPKLVLICDVSGSVARYVRFLLLFLYCMKDTVPDLYTFAFSARLKDVGKNLETGLDGFENAMQIIMTEAGWGSTDYGQALSDLRVNHWQNIDRRTTVIILGDGRSNHGDPRMDLFEELAGRSKRIVWLSPEGRSLWGTGDSEMLRYAPHCSVVTQMSTLKDLERSIDEVLTQYA